MPFRKQVKSKITGASLTKPRYITKKQIPMKIKKPDWKDIVIFIESAILFKLLFHFWDEVKAFISGIFV